ncbi:atrial natriuretic peptide-converting enzyme-like [Glandiceps talaboti]
MASGYSHFPDHECVSVPQSVPTITGDNNTLLGTPNPVPIDIGRETNDARRLEDIQPVVIPSSQPNNGFIQPMVVSPYQSMVPVQGIQPLGVVCLPVTCPENLQVGDYVRFVDTTTGVQRPAVTPGPVRSAAPLQDRTPSQRQQQNSPGAPKSEIKHYKGLCAIILVLFFVIGIPVAIYTAANSGSDATSSDTNGGWRGGSGADNGGKFFRVKVDMKLKKEVEEPEVFQYFASILELDVDRYFLLDEKLYTYYNFTKVISFRSSRDMDDTEKLTMRVFMKKDTEKWSISDKIESLISNSLEIGSYFALADSSSLSVTSDSDHSFPDTSVIHAQPRAPTHQNIGCGTDEFSCKSGRCADKSTLCNGYSECLDRSDEEWRRCYECQPILGNGTLRVTLPYTEAYFPNKVVPTMEEANQILESVGPYSICHRYATLFAAATVAPTCPDGTNTTQNICRLFCESVLLSCTDVIRELESNALTFDCTKLDNGPGCLTIPATAGCHEMEFRCDDGQCIHLSKKCNSYDDCMDGSDESDKYCNYGMKSCGDHQHLCRKEGKCIPVAWQNDGLEDCSDKSDEYVTSEYVPLCSNTCFAAFNGRCDEGEDGSVFALCEVGTDCSDCGRPTVSTDQSSGLCDEESQFQCYNGKCIEHFDKCDGINHCMDYSDESVSLCGAKTCSTYGNGAFSCSSTYECIYGRSRCDGNKDCRDNSDEMFCAQINNDHDSLLFVSYNGVLRPVCINDWNETHSQIVCNELGFKTVSHFSGIHNSYVGRPLRLQAWSNTGNFIREAFGDESYLKCLNDQVVSLSCKDVMCGARPALPPRASSRIVGGSSSAGGAWPWIVSLQNKTSDYFHFCGATVVGSRWLITAAHCFYESLIEENTDLTDVVAVLGVRDKTVDADNTPHRQEHQIKTFYIHPQYSPYDYENDLAILELASNITYGDYVRPACMASSNMDPRPGTVCEIAGWGVTKEGNAETPADLQEAKVPIVSHSTCGRLARDANMLQRIRDGMLCAGYNAGGIDTCQGDSGGPLICLNEDDGKWFLHGVTSFGSGCARQYLPGIYTKVSYYNDFIKTVIGDNNE